MPTSMVSNGDRGVWIHDGVGEVWLASLSTLILERHATHPLLLDLRQKIERGLEARWIVGALQYDVGSLLRDAASVPMPAHIYIPGRGWKLA